MKITGPHKSKSAECHRRAEPAAEPVGLEERGRPGPGRHEPPAFGPHAFPLTVLGPEANWQWWPHLQEKQRSTASSQ